MTQWLRRIRAVLAMGLIWAVGGVCVGGLIELVDNLLPAARPLTRLVDMWPPVLAVLAFRRGVVFAIVLGVARGRRRFEDFSLSEFAAWGAVAGLVPGAVAMAQGAGAVFLGITTILSAIAGAGSLALARMAETRALLATGARVTDAELAGGEPPRRLGDGR